MANNGLIDLPKVEPVEVQAELFEEKPAENGVKEFIEIKTRTIGGEEVNAVNARELWTKLEVKTDFSDWIKNRIDKYGFVEGVDYLLLKKKEQVPHQGGMRSVEKKDYYISLDMAKELSMVENNAKGKQARRYFIECEKKAKETPLQLDALLHGKLHNDFMKKVVKVLGEEHSAKFLAVAKKMR